MAGNSTDPGRSVTSKVTAILMAFTEDAVLTLTEIAGIAKLPTSTAHRLASELLAWRLLERTEDGGYRVGLPLRIIGKSTTDFDVLNRAILVVRARPVLAELARATSATAKLGVLQGREVLCLVQSTPHPHGAAAMASSVPAHSTAIGKALLAFSPTAVVDEIIAEGHWVPSAIAPTSPDNLRQALSVIRLTQIATARDEYQPDRSAIAMPVFSGGGRVAAAIELTIVDAGSDRKAVVSALTVACRSLSRQLATELRDHGTEDAEGSASA
jgi:DNA-binding IclR family transcriptional regulator